MEAEKLLEFYKNWLEFDHYYDTLLSRNNDEEFQVSSRFMNGIKSVDFRQGGNILAKVGDDRIDVPVWFGDLSRSEERILVLGLSPCNGESGFNVEKIGNKVFASPFGIDRWNENSSIKGRPQNKYHRVFNDLIENDNVFIIFSSLLKHFQIRFILKSENEKQFLKNFDKQFESEFEKLREEILMIEPTRILALGSSVYKIFGERFTSEKVYLMKHPSFGNEEGAKKALNNLFLP